MPRNFLIGPVSNIWAVQRLPASLHDQARTAGWGEDCHVSLADCESWQQFSAKWTAGWQPEFLLLLVGHNSLPGWLWTAPLPIVAVVAEQDLLWHHQRGWLRSADAIITSPAWSDRFRREGFARVHALPWLALDATWNETPAPNQTRDIDVLWIGSLDPVIDRERLAWLRPLARLSRDWNVMVVPSDDPAKYQPLLARAKLVVNVANRRAWPGIQVEAAAAGALLLQVGCWEDVEAIAESYLRDESQRQRKVDEARQHAGTTAASWERLLELVEAEWAELVALTPGPSPHTGRGENALTPGPSPKGRGEEEFHRRASHLLAEGSGAEPTLVRDLATWLAIHPHDADAHNTLGVAVAFLARGQGPLTAQIAQTALDHFARAVHANPLHVLARLNLVEVLVLLDQKDAVVREARTLLTQLEQGERLDSELLNAALFLPEIEWFQVLWEDAARLHAGDPIGEARAKWQVLRWRTHFVLGHFTDALAHFYEAALACPTVPPTQAALGCKLGREGLPHAAVVHLKQACAADPLDRGAVSALQVAYTEVQDHVARRQLEVEMALLHRLGLVAKEEWFECSLHAPREDVLSRSERTTLAWRGPFAAVSSLAKVNRAICTGLLRLGHDVRPVPTPEPASAKIVLDPQLAERLSLPAPPLADVTVSSQWPPDLRPPAYGHWVVMQPWEFGSIPKEWLAPLQQLVDEIWVPTSYVRECFLRSGVPADRVHVVPLGARSGIRKHSGEPRDEDPEFLRIPLRTSKRFKFLYVGGTIHRKGIDVLLRAYREAFTSRDDVCLVIKDMGKSTFYKGQTAELLINRFRDDLDAGEIVYLDQDLSDDEMMGLYRECDCLVQPYRGEGFCLPIAEAMACGLPVIVTGHGAALDYYTPENAYLIPAQVQFFRDKHVGAIETVDVPWLAEPDGNVLRMLMRRVFEHPEEARTKAEKGRATIQRHFTWEHTTAAVVARLAHLRTQPVRRHHAPRDGPITRSVMPTITPHDAPLTRSVRSTLKPGVSLCIIAKNEEKHLPACLESVRGIPSEIIVLDTGSTDATREIAARYGAKVIDFPWPDSFAAARNESIRHATHEWIFWMDADDRLDEVNRQKLRTLFSQLPKENVAYVMDCLCVADHETGTETVVNHVRLFRNDPRHRWKYRVHEQILSAIRASGGKVVPTDVVIHHVGYQDPKRMPAKHQRDLRLLQLDHADSPHEPYTLFYLGWTHSQMGKLQEAIHYLQESLTRSAAGDSIVRKLYALLAQCHKQMGQHERALAICREGLRVCVNDPELLFEQSLLLCDERNWAGAEASLLQLIHLREGTYFASVDPGLRTYKAYHLLGVVYHQQNRIAEARRAWETALAERPDFVPAVMGLLDLCLEQQNWPEFETLLSRLAGLPGSQMPVDVMRARGHLRRHEYVPARGLLEQTIQCYPDALWPRRVLTYVLLEEHRDLDAAETALREVLRLAPDDAQSRRNLQVVLAEKQRR